MKQLAGLLVVFLLALGSCVAQAAYNPLRIAANTAPQVLDREVHDTRRQRVIPIRIYLPRTHAAAPVILFSPGLGGSREGYAYLARHWARRGYAVVVLQHPGSDNRIWQDKTRAQAIAAMRHAASGRNFLLRIQDVKRVLDYLCDADQRADDPLAGRLKLDAIGMAGHSFGAVTTEAVSGERFRGRALFTDPRIKAALALSPSSPRQGSVREAFDRVAIPWMLMTGTRDIGLLGLGAQTVASRLAVYTALPPGHKYELVLADAPHMAFSDRPLAASEAARDPNDHRAIVALSTAFWDAMLAQHSAAQTWLTTRAQTVLKPGDQWFRK